MFIEIPPPFSGDDDKVSYAGGAQKIGLNGGMVKPFFWESGHAPSLAAGRPGGVGI
jgi:hypothetical protein